MDLDQMIRTGLVVTGADPKNGVVAFDQTRSSKPARPTPFVDDERLP